MPVTPERKRELRARAKALKQEHAKALGKLWGRLGTSPEAAAAPEPPKPLKPVEIVEHVDPDGFVWHEVVEP